MAFEDLAKQINLASIGVGVGRTVADALNALGELHYDENLTGDARERRERELLDKVERDHGVVIVKQGEAQQP